MLTIRVDIDTGAVEHAVRGGLDKSAEAMARVIYTLSQAEVPVRFGNLSKSGRVEWNVNGTTRSEKGAPIRRRPRGDAAVVYGDDSVPYAAAVHDGVRGTGVKGQSVKVASYHQGKSQYLRDPAMRARELREAGAAALRKALIEANVVTGRKTVAAVKNFGPGGTP